MGGSPVSITVLPAAAEVSCCELRAAAPGTAAEPLRCVAGQPAMLDLLSRDGLCNPCGGGERFEVPGNSSFQLKVSEISDYCCSFLD